MSPHFVKTKLKPKINMVVIVQSNCDSDDAWASAIPATLTMG